ncbi:unnamed protein product [Medioppia subpectinata]|uniref:chitinase n=1 Tax=Medioppia subpectinata TaxID=1979941 RepID=A0A7R9PX13_9ACAR|nr:unnamed protein product [Medioppia subpectinata]CAG2104302.1 unnamed protein product [Medioppia subpectinata]
MNILLNVCLFVLFSSLDSATVNRSNGQYKVVCYWGSWSYYRPNAGQFQPANMDPNLCTHMMYGFAKLNEFTNKIEVFEADLDLGDESWESGLHWGRGMYRHFNNLRQKNPNLKTMISIGGWNEGSDKYSKMVSNPESRRVFVQSCLDFLLEHKFDGLDLDWEYPVTTAVGGVDRLPGNAADKDNFISLVRELHAVLKPRGYLLAAAVSAGAPTAGRGYHVKELSDLLDFINLMTYDFNGGWDKRTAHNAPLYPWANANEQDTMFTVSYGVDFWLNAGADPQKLVMGLPLYGRSFKLANPGVFGLQAPAEGAGGDEGPYTRQVGILGYLEICDKFRTESWSRYRDDTQKIPYAVKGNQWIGYDDQTSLTEKVNFLKSRGLGGACIWSIDTDDFNGVCGEGRFPLLTQINNALRGGVAPPPVPSGAPVEPTSPPQPGPGDFVCTAAGSFVDPKDPTRYYQCLSLGGGKFQTVERQCGPGTQFDEKIGVCVHSY